MRRYYIRCRTSSWIMVTFRDKLVSLSCSQYTECRCHTDEARKWTETHHISFVITASSACRSTSRSPHVQNVTHTHVRRQLPTTVIRHIHACCCRGQNIYQIMADLTLYLIICPIAIAYSMGQIIKSVCVCVCLSVCRHSHGRISLSIFTKFDTEV